MRRSPRSLLSALLFALSVGLFAAGGYLYLEGRDEDTPRVPDAAPGRNELIHVEYALEDEGIDVEATPGSVTSRMLEDVGQSLTVDGVTAYVFIYADAAEQEAVTLDVLPEDVDLVNTGGEPIPATDLRLFTGSNVAVVLVGGDDELAGKVEAAVASLP